MKNKENKRSKASCILLSAIFIGYVAAYTLGTFLIKDRDFSEMENRTLAQKPELTTEKVFSGEFESGFESYMSDQIFVKDAMMSLKTCCDYFSGKTYQNGVSSAKTAICSSVIRRTPRRWRKISRISILLPISWASPWTLS